MSRARRGFTLIEILIVLAIGALLLGLSAPGLGRVVQAQQGEAVINDLARLLNYARNAAVTADGTVTVCRSGDGLSCGGKWEQGALVFIDRNGDGAFDAGDQLLQRKTFADGKGSLVQRAFPNRQYLQFSAEGFTHGQNGTFTWCAPDGSPQLAQQLVYMQSGRVRL
ncbi:MAG TPA: GspH/FimT family pseudopilin, partial [Candidatus Acidoferrum sp.]|nr:GspH/FimT family pseudopilin [Candidatus Acidoferrum sp.]